MTTPEFSTGMGALKQAIATGQQKAKEREERKASFGPSSDLFYFGLKPGEKQIVRFMTDDILTADFYLNIICRDGVARTFLANPGNPELLLRYMASEPGIGWKKEFSGETVKPYASRQTVNIAVKRKEILHEGKMVLVDDKFEREIGNQKIDSLCFVIVQQAISNFWEPLHSSIFDRYQSICDADLEIIRTGSQKTTLYSFQRLPQVPEMLTPEAVAQTYFYGTPWDEKDPQRFMKCPMTVLEWAAYFSAEERYARWLTPEGSTPTVITSPSPTGIQEFRPETTSNPAPAGDEAQAGAPATQFSTFRQELLDKAAAQQANGS